MEPDCSPSELCTLRAAARPGLDWPEIQRAAIAVGAGECLTAGEERIAAVDELLSRSLRELVLLGELAALAGLPPLAELCRRPLERTTAGVVRCSTARSSPTDATTATASSAGATAWS